MSEISWARVGDLFEQALEQASDRRRSFLEHACAGADGLRREVQSLLDALAAENGRFAAPSRHLLADLGAAISSTGLDAGDLIGPYRVVRVIGQGGMGSVYEAHRVDDDFRKRVAIKTLGWGRGREELLRRFRQERRILARLDHPHIAALLDGGITPDGLPYFAMEYVEGEPIDRYSRTRQLPLPQRIRLMRQVCAAVHYAHQNLVVHRDLKPGNILVSGDGAVKLLDFGVAKLLSGGDDSTEGDLTEAGVAALTPSYASPEQLRGDPITTASDIHALGIVLYQILTGRHPFKERDTPAVEVRRRILEATPPRSGLDADLDAILRTALRKDPPERYGSAEQLAGDLDRYLRGVPVSAQPDTFTYRIGKLIRRHRVGVAAAAAIALLLVGGVIATSWQARRAETERQRAEEFSRFMSEVLAAPDPLRVGRDARVVDILNAAAIRARTELVGQPATRAAILRTIGETYSRLLVLDSAGPLLREALTIHQQELGERHPETARTRIALGRVLALTDESEAGVSLLAEGVAALERQGESAGPDLVSARLDYGNALLRRGRLDPAGAALEAALRSARQVYGDRHLLIPAALQALAVLHDHQGDRSGAKQRFREAIIALRGLGAPARANLAVALYDLANVLKLEDSLSAADSLVSESIGLTTGLYGPNNFALANFRTNLADIRRRQGRREEAEAELRSAVAILRTNLTPGHVDLAPALSLLGLVQCERGAGRNGEVPLREALEIRRRALPPGHWLTHNLESALAVCLTVQGRFAAAESLGQSGFQGLRDRLGAEHPRTAEAASRLVTLYERWGRPDQAAKYRPGSR